MTKESIVKTISVTLLSAFLFIMSYLFYLAESAVYIFLLFIGIILALIVASGFLQSEKTK